VAIGGAVGFVLGKQVQLAVAGLQQTQIKGFAAKGSLPGLKHTACTPWACCSC
jgi:hypothetical protein